MTLLDTTLTLRTQLRDELPVASEALGSALVALDTVEACIRRAQSDGEKARASALAGVDVDTLRPVEKQAWAQLVRAKDAAAEEARLEAERAAAKAAEDAAAALAADADAEVKS